MQNCDNNKTTRKWNGESAALLKKKSVNGVQLFFASFRDLKEDQTQIRFNLVVAIAIAQITFLAGIDATEVMVS